jgi:hypothetical protein
VEFITKKNYEIKYIVFEKKNAKKIIENAFKCLGRFGVMRDASNDRHTFMCLFSDFKCHVRLNLNMIIFIRFRVLASF